jgi:hypothetical protein
MPRPKSLRSQLYRAARDLGDLQAAEIGHDGLRQVSSNIVAKLTTAIGDG